jgi:hydrogenase expression/formation protein HypC
MCLAIPLRVKEVEKDKALVYIGESTMEISIIFTPEVKTGDFVLVHAGFSISVVNEDEAKEIMEVVEGT